MAKAMLRVEVVNPSTHDPELSRLVQTVHRLSRQAHLSSMPEVGVFPSHEVNAFATGPSAKRSLVAVSSALLHKMSDKEMEGVLAHEISHITNGDMVTMTLLQGVVNAFVMFMARALAFFLSGMGKGQKRSSSSYGSYMILVLVFQIFFMILGSIVIAAFSRYREFRADRGGADLAGKDKMIAALEALKRVINIHDPATDKEAIAAFKISETKKRSGLVSLFASHPPLDERIARLKGI
jgi:heat shock protein HtpX